MLADIDLFANRTVAPVLKLSHLVQKALADSHFRQSLWVTSLDERNSHHREKALSAFILIGNVEQFTYRLLPKEDIVPR